MVWRITFTERDGEKTYYHFESKHEALGWFIEKVIQQNYAKYEIEFIVKPS
jgi:hypothetical protein